MRRKLDKAKLRARVHWAEAGPFHLGYCGLIAWEAHGFVSLFAGGMAICILLLLLLPGGVE